MATPISLSLAEWTVLAVLDEEPAHGFAIAALTGADGELGRVWQIPRPVVYRAISRLEDARLAAPLGEQPGRGPRRLVHRVTPAGSAGVRQWLAVPVRHVRDVRSDLLMKLALLERRGEDPTELLRRQRALLVPIVVGLAAEASFGSDAGFDAVLAAWRRSSAEATLAFVDDLLASRPRTAGPRPARPGDRPGDRTAKSRSQSSGR